MKKICLLMVIVVLCSGCISGSNGDKGKTTQFTQEELREKGITERSMFVDAATMHYDRDRSVTKISRIGESVDKVAVTNNGELVMKWNVTNVPDRKKFRKIPVARKGNTTVYGINTTYNITSVGWTVWKQPA